MDRICAFFYHRDRQCLDQAVMVCLKQPVDLNEVRIFAEQEKQLAKYEVFLDALNAKRSGQR